MFKFPAKEIIETERTHTNSPLSSEAEWRNLSKFLGGKQNQKHELLKRVKENSKWVGKGESNLGADGEGETEAGEATAKPKGVQMDIDAIPRVEELHRGKRPGKGDGGREAGRRLGGRRRRLPKELGRSPEVVLEFGRWRLAGSGSGSVRFRFGFGRIHTWGCIYQN